MVPGEVLEHSLQVLGCFLVLSVLIWASKSEPHPVRPLLAAHFTRELDRLWKGADLGITPYMQDKFTRQKMRCGDRRREVEKAMPR